MNSDLQMTIFVVFVLNLAVLYFIFRGAASSANSNVERLLKILINLKTEEMKKQGFTDQEISQIINRVK